jgi:hypothetical protein
MNILKSIAAGITAVMFAAIVSNVVFVLAMGVIWRNVPNILIGWDQSVWETIRNSPAFWLVAILSFFVGFRWMYRKDSLKLQQK